MYRYDICKISFVDVCGNMRQHVAPCGNPCKPMQTQSSSFFLGLWKHPICQHFAARWWRLAGSIWHRRLRLLHSALPFVGHLGFYVECFWSNRSVSPSERFVMLLCFVPCFLVLYVAWNAINCLQILQMHYWTLTSGNVSKIIKMTGSDFKWIVFQIMLFARPCGKYQWLSICCTHHCIIWVAYTASIIRYCICHPRAYACALQNEYQKLSRMMARGRERERES